MAAISHSVNQFKLLNLGYLRGGKGPYVIRQDGHAPGSITMEQHRFYLLDDGSWMLNYAFFLLPEEEQQQHLFGSLQEVFAAIDELAGKKVVVNDKLPEGATKEKIMASMRDIGNRLSARLYEAKAGSLGR
jgi:hypothetical protein